MEILVVSLCRRKALCPKAASIPISIRSLSQSASHSLVPCAGDSFLTTWGCYCGDEYACLIETIEGLHPIAMVQRTYFAFPILLNSSKRPFEHPNRLPLASSPPPQFLFFSCQSILPSNLLLHPPKPLPGDQWHPQAFPPHG